MARWSNATLVALGGFDKNVIIDELLIGEDNYYDITFTADTSRFVLSVTGQTVNITGGDTSVFAVNGYVTFGASNQIYQIASKTNTSLTLVAGPVITALNGEQIQIPIDLTGASFQFRLLQHSARIEDDTRAGINIGDITPFPGATVLNLDANVLTNVPGQSIVLGQIRVLINDTDLTDNPIIDTYNPPFYTGYVGVNFPPAGSTPAQFKKQRICFVVRADGTNS